MMVVQVELASGTLRLEVLARFLIPSSWLVKLLGAVWKCESVYGFGDDPHGP